MSRSSRGRWAAVTMLLGLALGATMIAASLSAVASGASWDSLLDTMPREYVDGTALGAPDAPVRIVLYGDFQCGHCERLHREVEPELIWRYVATGKARLEVRQIPVLGPASLLATEAALGAAAQGRFWEYRDALYAEWVRSGGAAYAPESLGRLAARVGLDAESLSGELEAGSHRSEIQGLLRSAAADEVGGVPVMLVNGSRIEGAKPFAVYAQAIEQELAR